MSPTEIPDYVNAKVIKGSAGMAILIRPKYESVRIRLLGSTIKTAIQHEGFEDLDQLILYPVADEDGIVALVIIHAPSDQKRSFGPYYIPCFLKVSWTQNEGEDRQCNIELNEPWTPTEHTGQLTAFSIEFTIADGKHFSTHASAAHNKGENQPRYFPDGNLACRFLWGSATEEEVLEVAGHHELELSAAEQVRRLDGRIENLTDAITRSGSKLSTYYNIINALEGSKFLSVLYKLLKRLPAWFFPKFFKNFIEAMNGVYKEVAAHNKAVELDRY